LVSLSCSPVTKTASLWSEENTIRHANACRSNYLQGVKCCAATSTTSICVASCVRYSLSLYSNYDSFIATYTFMSTHIHITIYSFRARARVRVCVCVCANYWSG
jgi:hypothetical protein